MRLEGVVVALGVWLRVIPQLCHGIVGYECGSSASNITTVSLLDVDECEMPTPTLNVSSVHIQFLQLNEFTSVQVRQCKVEIRRTVFRCGMHSHSSLISAGSYVAEVTQESCNRMHDYGSLEVAQAHLSGLKGNHSRSYSVTLAGKVEPNGACEGVWYSDPFGGYGTVAVLGDITVTLRDYRARVGLENNKVYLSSGMRCDLSAGNCVDIDGGPSFWDAVPMQDCGYHQYSVLYEGMAQKVTGEGSKTMYSLVQSDVTFALTALPPVNVCGQTLVRTEHPRLLVHELTSGRGFLRPEKLDISNMDMFAYINSKFVFVEKHIRTEIQRLYSDVIMHKCVLEREMLRNRLAIATQSPDEFAYFLMKGPGYMTVLAGEVVHVIKCIPVEVKMQHLKECYSQLPVTLDNNTYFMSPRTHVLMKTGMQITCNKLVPPMYYIDGEWYGMSPEPMLVFPPETIKPMTKPTWKYKDTQSLAVSGIYTATDLDKLREHVMFPVEQPAVLNSLAREIMGKPAVNQGGSFANLLKGPEISIMVESAWNKTWDKFMMFGHVSAGLIGIIIVFRGVKLVVDTLIHGYALHTVYGWSLYLVGAVWDSVTGLLLHLKRRAGQPGQAGGTAAPDKEKGTELSVVPTSENCVIESGNLEFKGTSPSGEIPSKEKMLSENRVLSVRETRTTLYPDLTGANGN